MGVNFRYSYFTILRVLNKRCTGAEACRRRGAAKGLQLENLRNMPRRQNTRIDTLQLSTSESVPGGWQRDIF